MTMRVNLIPLEESHALTSWKWRNNPAIWKYTLNKPDREITLEDEQKWIQQVLKNEQDKRFAIVCDEIYVGNIYLTGINNGESFYGIFIGEEAFMGKGIAQEATKILLDYAKNVLGLKRIKLRVNRYNVAALALYKKLGWSEQSVSEDIVEMELLLTDNPS